MPAKAMFRPYRHHVFFCCNQREAPAECCNNHGAENLLAYAKTRAAELGLTGPGELRLNKAGCLGRCAEGPVIVIYPEGTWYRYGSREDIDEILSEHLLHGRIVERLKV